MPDADSVCACGEEQAGLVGRQREAADGAASRVLDLSNELASEYVGKRDATSAVAEEDVGLCGAYLGREDRAVPGQGEYGLVVLVENVEGVGLEGWDGEVVACAVAADRVLDVDC